MASTSLAWWRGDPVDAAGKTLTICQRRVYLQRRGFKKETQPPSVSSVSRSQAENVKLLTLQKKIIPATAAIKPGRDRAALI